MLDDLSKKMRVVCRLMGVNFILNGKPLTHAEVFSDVGLMPALARRADQLCSLCLGYGMGLSFEDKEDTILGVKIIFDDVTPSSLRLLCITDVVCELIHASANKELVALDELMYD